MITTSNISEYINFLHLKKYSFPAAEDLKTKWRTVPSSDLNVQLKNLYHHWQISDQEGKNFENEFLSLKQPMPYTGSNYSAPSNPQPAPTNSYQQPYQPAPVNTTKSNTLLWVLLGLILLGGLGFAAYYFLNNNEDNRDNDASVLKENTTTTDVPTTEIPEVKIPDSPVEVKKNEPTTKDLTVAQYNELMDKSYAISSLLAAETERNLDGILAQFSDKMYRYWDLTNPTETQLKNRYYHTWGITEDISYANERIQRVGDNIYDLYSDYSYYSIKEGKTKTFKTQTRFIFGDDGKIVSTYGVK